MLSPNSDDWHCLLCKVKANHKNFPFTLCDDIEIQNINNNFVLHDHISNMYLGFKSLCLFVKQLVFSDLKLFLLFSRMSQIFDWKKRLKSTESILNR